MKRHSLIPRLLPMQKSGYEAGIGGGTRGALGAHAPRKFYAGGQCSHKILQWQALIQVLC